MKKATIISLALFISILPTFANAQTHEPLAADNIPAGTITDRFTTQPWVTGLDASFVEFGDGMDARALHLDIHGQLLRDVGTDQMGGYLNIPLSYVNDNGDHFLSLGNIELGALSVTGNQTMKVIFRGGLSLQTAHGLNEGDEYVAYFSSIGRITDLVTQFPNTNWLRLSASPVYRGDRFFVRGDIGLDFLVPRDSGPEIDPLVRLNLAAGVNLDKVILMAELATIRKIDDVYNYENWAKSASFTVQGTGRVAPFGGIVVHIDEGLRDVMTLAVTAGVRTNALNVAD